MRDWLHRVARCHAHLCAIVRLYGDPSKAGGQSNAGETYDAVSKQWVPAGHAAHTPFAEQALGWAAAGALAIGGCCRTSPADIGALFTRWSAAR